MALLTRSDQEKVVSLLIEEGLVNREQTEAAKAEADQKHRPLIAALVDKRIATDAMIAHATAVVVGIPYVNLKGVLFDASTLELLSRDIATRTMAVPLGEKDGYLVLAMLDVSNVQATDYLSQLTGKPIRALMASSDGIQSVLDQYKGDFTSVDQAVKATNAEKTESEAAAAEEEVRTITQDSPISKALNTILDYAVRSNASDVHIEPLENSLVIRCRIDGVLRKVMELPKAIEPALVSRVKILANLKIDEHRAPQDGQFTVNVNGKEVDLRIAIAPVVWGEQVVIRLLDKSGNSFEIEDMGMVGRALRTVIDGVDKPNGMILTSGPTGSGKSTTLYALIKRIKDEKINIVTLEDPVEYKMDGVNQIQVNLDAGLSFASGLRSILRQDPDVVMVGEIRDGETAGLAVQAALTGHLVFSTLHTNSAAGILPRLLDMGVAKRRSVVPSSALQTEEINSVVGALLPKSQAEVAQVGADLGYDGLPVANAQGYSLVAGQDTPETPGGYAGRAGLYEAITVDEDIQKLIVARATSADIMRVARAKGTVTMRQDGFLKALAGITTIDEVNRVASDLA